MLFPNPSNYYSVLNIAERNVLAKVTLLVVTSDKPQSPSS